MKKALKHMTSKTIYLWMHIIWYVTLIFILDTRFDAKAFFYFLTGILSLIISLKYDKGYLYTLLTMITLMIISIYDRNAFYFIIIPLFQLSYKGFGYIVLATIPFIFIYQLEFILIISLIQSVIVGTILFLWKKSSESITLEYDHTRLKSYELKNTQEKLLEEVNHIELISRSQERNKIAQRLHDDLGHDLTGAYLALESYYVLKPNTLDENAEKRLDIVSEKLKSALKNLRKTVSEIEPLLEDNGEILYKMLDNFLYPIEYHISEDFMSLNNVESQMINSLTKEILTNIAKHAVPNFVKYKIDINNVIIRLSVINDGILKKHVTYGKGIIYMRQRVEAIKGSLSITSDKDFKIIITLPRSSKNENFNS